MNFRSGISSVLFCFFILTLYANTVLAADKHSALPATSSLIVKMKEGVSQDEVSAAIVRNGGRAVSSVPALRLQVVEVPSNELSTALLNYQSDPLVERVETNQVRKVETLAPPDPLYSGQWYLPKIGWDTIYGTWPAFGHSTVAILDTGIDAFHPDLAGNIVAGTSIIDGSGGTVDPNGHGTFLAGIVAAVSNDTGIAGVGFSGVSIMPVKVLGPDGTGKDADIIAGILYAVDHGANVILMGFSNAGFSQNLQDAIDYAWSKDAVLIAATGNGGKPAPTFPAGDSGVMGVSATDRDDALAPFSNYGKDVFMAAPGVDILTTGLDHEKYPTVNGTSAASAIVAAAAAFMRAYDPTLSNGTVVWKLASTADAAGSSVDETGNGRLNMAGAMAKTGYDSIKPAGVPGGGGPYVGPYVAAATTPLKVYFITSGIISGVPVTVGNIKYAVQGGSLVSSYRFISPGSTRTAAITNIKPGSSFSFSFPSTITTARGSIFALSGTTPTSPIARMTSNRIIKAIYKTVCLIPTIKSGPSSQTKAVGSSVTFSVSTSGTSLSYQWRKDGSDITGATGSSYTIPSVVMSDAGIYSVFVSNSCGSATSRGATLTVTGGKATPVITWNNPADITYGTALGPVQLNATASVPGTFIYTPPAGTKLDAGNGQKLHADFTPTDTASYNNASKDVAINVLKAAATITLGNLNQTYDGTPKSATATTNPPGLAVTITYNGSSTPPTDAGTYAVVATVNDANYQGSATGTLTISKEKTTPEITWNNPADITYGTALGPVQLNATASVPGTFTYTPPAGTILNVGSGQKLHVDFTPTDTASYNSTSKDVAINVLKAAATVTLSNLNQAYDGTPKRATATTNPPGLAVTITYNGSSTPPTDAGTYAVVATVNDANYQGSASGTMTISKEKTTPEITWNNPADITYGTALGPVQLNATASVPGAFVYTPPAGTILNVGSGQKLHVDFTPTDTASYNNASKDVTINVLKAAATVTLSNLNQTYDGTPKSATATTNPPGLAVTITYNGFSTPPTDAGTYAVVATVNDANYQGSATGTLTIEKATATVTLGSLNQVYDGTPKSATATTNPPGLAVILTYDGLPEPPAALGSYSVVGTVSDANYQGSATGTLTILAYQTLFKTPYYGSCISSDSLICNYGKTKVAIRFRSQKGGTPASLKLYCLWYPGYGAGDFGTKYGYRVELHPDDGTDDHYPGDEVLASVKWTPVINTSKRGGFLDIPLGDLMPSLVPGNIYHIVLVNLSPNPTSNYMGFDNFWHDHEPHRFVDSIFACEKWDPSYGWTSSNWPGQTSWPLDGMYPIYDITLTDGRHEGIGYMELRPSSSHGVHNFGGSAKVRENFTVSEGNRVVTGIGWRLAHLSGQNTFTFRLEKEDGSLIESVNLTDVPDSSSWVHVNFASPHTLNEGQGYNLVLSAPSGSSFSATGMEKGVIYGFGPDTYWNDGEAQYSSDGSNWLDWDPYSVPCDMFFYFDVQ